MHKPINFWEISYIDTYLSHYFLNFILFVTLIAILVKSFNVTFDVMAEKNFPIFFVFFCFLSCIPSRTWSHCFRLKIIVYSYMNIVNYALLSFFRRNNQLCILVHQMAIEHTKMFKILPKICLPFIRFYFPNDLIICFKTWNWANFCWFVIMWLSL